MSVENYKQIIAKLAQKVTFNTENLYQHNVMIRFNDGNRKACASFINNDNTDYTRSLSRFIEYMKNTYSSENSNATGNLKNLLICDGYYRNASNIWYVPKFLYYSTDANTVRVLGYRNIDSVAPNSLEVLADYGTTFSVTDYVTTVALNNVNKPTLYETTTNVTYNGSTIGTCYWKLLKYPVNATKFKYEWVGKATCSNVSIPVTSATGNVYQSTATLNISQPSVMTNTQRSSLKTDMYSQANWGFFLYPIGSPLMNYLMRPTTATVNGALDINVYGTTIE